MKKTIEETIQNALEKNAILLATAEELEDIADEEAVQETEIENWWEE